MKKTLLLATLLIAAGAHAQVLESGFENWTDGAPDDWNGSKTHATGITAFEVSENVHGGSLALGLDVPGTSHRRYTTQPLTVEAGVEYTVSFWVRGAGEIRVGLFDDRESGSGYSPYSPYTTATGTWTQVSQTIAAVNNTDIAEFILSVRSTSAPDHVVVDDVTITSSGGINEVSIYDIQFTTNPNGDSPYNGAVVSTSGIVTATYITYNDDNEPQYRYTYLQDGSGPW
ncbi:MAG: carbohydrate binding domain-containing protein, partial [Flavobacteriales bacterium]|nr:carbohydrate binding domain-containing protein [Flavobacteriales bacterium]